MEADLIIALMIVATVALFIGYNLGKDTVNRRVLGVVSDCMDNNTNMFDTLEKIVDVLYPGTSEEDK